jgi:hypothetical protein
MRLNLTSCFTASSISRINTYEEAEIAEIRLIRTEEVSGLNLSRTAGVLIQDNSTSPQAFQMFSGTVQ